MDISSEMPHTAPVPSTIGVPVAVPHYRTTQVDGVDIFYREAGSEDAPVVVLLHGFPTSSHMFRNVLPALADRYHVIAPDYPGFGLSAMPDHTQFPYTFAKYADLKRKALACHASQKADWEAQLDNEDWFTTDRFFRAYAPFSGLDLEISIFHE